MYIYAKKKTQWTSMHPFPLNISRYKNYLLLLSLIFACKSFYVLSFPPSSSFLIFVSLVVFFFFLLGTRLSVRNM